jgi:hypothetical protein
LTYAVGGSGNQMNAPVLTVSSGTANRGNGGVGGAPVDTGGGNGGSGRVVIRW